MTWASIATQFVLTVGASLAERLAWALSARIKQEPETANPVDIAIATKSAVSADREGKIASDRAVVSGPIGHVARVRWMWPRSAELEITPSWFDWRPTIGAGWVLSFCPDDGTRPAHRVQLEATIASLHIPTDTAYVKWVNAVVLPKNVDHSTMRGWYVFASPPKPRRLGDYGPGGG